MKNDHPSELNDTMSINECMKGLKNFPKNLQEKETNLEYCSKGGQNLNIYLFCKCIRIPFIRFV